MNAKAMIVTRVISAIEMGADDKDKHIPLRRMHTASNVRKALHSTPPSAITDLSCLTVYDWYSVVYDSQHCFCEWATRAASYGKNAYTFA